MIVDHELVTQVEDALVAERLAFAEGMASRRAEAGWLPVAGGQAVCTGRDFFSNRAMGLGVHESTSVADIERVEAFYSKRDLPSEIEVASMADRGLLQALGERRYQPVRFRNIYAMTLPGPPTPSASTSTTSFEVAEVDDAIAARWSDALLDGFEYTDPVDRSRVTLWNQMIHDQSAMTAFAAVVGGEVVGAASVIIVGTSAVLGGAATVPAYRRRGIQTALIRARLDIARRAGCGLAVVTADPGSISGRNCERTGFQMVCNHLVMRR